MNSKYQYRLHGGSKQHLTEFQIARQSPGESEDLYRDLVEHNQDLHYTHDLQGKLLSVDPITARLLGYEVDELLKMSLPGLLAPESRDQFKQRMEKVQRNGMDGGAMLVQTRTGERRVWEFLNTLRSDERGSPIVQGIAHDATECMWAEEELRRSEERYESLIGAMAEGVVVLDAVGKIAMCNPAAERILGPTAGQLIGRTLMDPCWGAIHEDGSPFPVEDQPAMVTLRTGQPQLGVCMGVQKPDGTRTWIIINSQAVLHTSQTLPHSVVTTFIDITERKRTEEALRTSEGRYRRFVERNTAGAVISTLDGRILQINDAVRRMLGYGSIQEVLACNLSELYLDLNDRAVMVQLLKKEKSLSNYELRFKRKDGGRISTLANLSLVEDGEDVIEGTFIDISASKQAQDALSEERALLRTLIDNMPDYIYVKDIASRFLVANCGLAQLVGVKTPNDLLGKTDFDFFPKELATAFFNDEQAIMQSGKPLLSQEEDSMDSAGNAKWTLTSKVPLRDKNGQVIGIVGIGRDITEQKRAEEALRASEERYRRFMERNTAGAVINTLDGRLLQVNDAVTRTLGYGSIQEILTHNMSELYADPNDRATMVRLLKEKKSLSNYELRFKRKDGVAIPVLANISLVEDGEDVIEGTFVDISASKQALDALSEEQALLRTLIDNMPDCIYVKDIASRFLVANCGVAQFMGAKTPDDLLGKTDFNFYPKEIATAFFNDEQEVMRSGKVLINREEASVDSAGNAKWLLTSKVPLRDPDGHVIGIVGVGRDITIRKRAEKELGESEERFKKAFYSSPEGMSITTLSHKRIIEVNDAALRICGYERSEVIGKTARELDIWANPGEVSTLLRENGVYGSVRDKKTGIRTKSEIVRQVLVSAEIIQSQGEPCLLIIFRDVTEQETLENQFRQAQKMEAVGRLAGGIAHDFNNLLSVILGYSDLLLETLPPTDPSSKKIEQIHKAGQRAAGLTRQLLAFSRQQVLQLSILDLNTVVTDIDKMLRRMIGEDVEVITLLGSELGRVKADVGQVEQVLMNLSINARDAMPRGGRLTIETANAEVDDAYAQHHMPMKPGLYVLLSVTDSGVGMDASVQAHLFEPFFTTKELGKGTGLGLSTVYGIIKQSGGFIWVYSEPGRGTTFKVYFPRVDAHADSSRHVASTSSFRGSETILLVEDAAPLRELTRELLQHCGYTVLDSGEPLEAIRLAQEHQGPIQLLLTDVVMPGMSGPALAEKLAGSRPEMKVLLVSGYTDDAMVRHGVEESRTAFLQKPFTRESLTRKVRDVLDAVPAQEKQEK